MKIQTFQKIQQKLIDLTLLPVSLFIAINIYYWQGLWDSHNLLTTIAFLASSLSSVHFLFVNISSKPWIYLRQVYMNNKKYKTLRKIQLTKSQHMQKSKTLTQQKEETKKQPKHKVNHFTFNLEDQQEIQSQSQKQFTKEKKINRGKDSSLKRFGNVKNFQKTAKIQSKSPNQLDALQMLMYSPKRDQTQKKIGLKQKIISDETKTEQDIEFQKQSKQVKKFIGEFILSKAQSQQTLQQSFDKKNQLYKKTLQQFEINQFHMERMIDETKLVVREKIEQHLKKQFENLESIENILRNNFDAHFKSYKDKSSIKGTNNVYGQSFGVYQNKNRTSGQESYLNQPRKFSQVLQQCVNLKKNNYFHFQFTGEVQKIDQVQKQIKQLIGERIKLDEYLSLRWPLSLDLPYKSKKCEFRSEFEEERYLNLLKLKNLAQILGEKKSAQQNLLKEFFSTQRTFLNEESQIIEQINDEKNKEFIMNFIVKLFKEKLQSANASSYIQIQLQKPLFSDRLTNYIWVAKIKGLQNHYNIAYTSHTKKEETIETQNQPFVENDQKKQKPIKPTLVYCCPGENNIWVCITLIRQIISKIGLRKQKYPMIKNIQLRKDFERLVELVK